jgi:hypothetical protein
VAPRAPGGAGEGGTLPTFDPNCAQCANTGAFCTARCRASYVTSTLDADVVGASIKKFKESAKAKAAPNPAADQRRSRLAAAVPAKGDADPASPAEPDPFEAGYQSG